jgi:predicted nucleic acid-binding protein
LTLVDAGPLVALIDKGEPDHQRCVDTLGQLSGPLLTTWPAFTEAIYLLGGAGGWPAQEALWRLVERDDLRLVDLDVSMRQRARDLMAKYHDVPMDLADASLVVVAESMNLRRVFSLDSDFHVYRIRNRRALEVLP